MKRTPLFSPLTKAVFLSVFNVIAAAVIYRSLYKTGWVTHHYDLRDPDSVNLVPVIVEPIAVLCVLAYWVWRTPFLYRLMFVLAHDPGAVRGRLRRLRSVFHPDLPSENDVKEGNKPSSHSSPKSPPKLICHLPATPLPTSDVHNVSSVYIHAYCLLQFAAIAQDLKKRFAAAIDLPYPANPTHPLLFNTRDVHNVSSVYIHV